MEISGSPSSSSERLKVSPLASIFSTLCFKSSIFVLCVFSQEGSIELSLDPSLDVSLKLIDWFSELPLLLKRAVDSATSGSSNFNPTSTLSVLSVSISSVGISFGS